MFLKYQLRIGRKDQKYLAIAGDVKKKIRPHIVVLMYLLNFFKTVCSMTKKFFKFRLFSKTIVPKTKKHSFFHAPVFLDIFEATIP